MYLPQHFEETRAEAIAELVEAAPLAAIVMQTDEGLIANHIPLLRAPAGHFIGHVALANDMHKLVGDQEVLAIFKRSDAYVSPNYYPSKHEHHKQVPTWNYEVAHVYGRMEFQHDTQSKRAAVGLLTRYHERKVNGDHAWRMADASADYMEQMLENIVAFRFESTRILAKRKLNQNKDLRDREGAADGLRAAGHDDIASRMLD